MENIDEAQKILQLFRKGVSLKIKDQGASNIVIEGETVSVEKVCQALWWLIEIFDSLNQEIEFAHKWLESIYPDKADNALSLFEFLTVLHGEKND